MTPENIIYVYIYIDEDDIGLGLRAAFLFGHGIGTKASLSECQARHLRGSDSGLSAQSWR